MDLHVHGRNMDISDRTREHIATKLEPINRHLPGISDATVELAHEATQSANDRIMAQVTLNVAGAVLRAQRRVANTKAAVNSVAKALDQQIKRYKSHAYGSERNRHGARAIDQSLEEISPGDAGPREDPSGGLETVSGLFPDGQIVRVKEFEMEPMSVE